jgi:adenylate cyclase
MLDRRVTSDPGADELPGFSRRRWEEIPERLERDFDRRALIPRLMVLGVGAFLEYGQGHRLAHWVVLVVYGATTVALAIWSKLGVRRSWLPWAATAVDAGLTVYVIADHLPRDAHDALHATEAVSLLPALLLLLQTGLRLRRDLVAFFAGIVALGWLASLWLFVGSDTLLATSDETTVATRQAHSFLSFAAAAGFVLYGLHRMRMASSAALRARFDRMLLSRFLPEGVAADVVRSDGAGEIAERDACLLSVDVRGFSALARQRPSGEVVARLMAFRRLVHDAVSGQQGIVDKYLGDGVLALFLEGTPAD